MEVYIFVFILTPLQILFIKSFKSQSEFPSSAAPGSEYLCWVIADKTLVLGNKTYQS